MVKYLALFACVLLCAVPVYAEPSASGYSGLILVPTADVVQAGQYAAGAFILNQRPGRYTTYLGQFGASRGLEVGLTSIRLRGGDRETVLNAKYQFQRERRGRAAIACGIYDPTDEVDSTAYFVASKTIRTRGKAIQSLRVHVGAGGGLLDGVFAGVSVELVRNLTAMIE
ncbi:MAG: hypothetical protein ACUVTZ_12835 [Armatimonadota bacterium]